MDTEEKIAKVTALTEQLGAVSADKIAQRIRESEVEKGEQGTAAKCPLALLFAKVLGFEVWITPARWSVPFYGLNDCIEGWEAEGDMPDSCVTFIDRIDDGFRGYADLVGWMDYAGNDLDDIESTDYEYPLSPKNEDD